jgi:pimeloyl-ACP methyl ester carboxylesterase
VELVYDEAGSGDRAFLLVHGFTGYRDDFASQLPRLARLGRTIAYDHRGHGDSAKSGDPARYSFDQLARDLLGFADALGLERFDLLGHSMGGMVALRFVLAHPERVASLVLMDTASEPLTGRLPRQIFEAGAKVGREAGMEKLLELVRANPHQQALRTEADRRLEQEWGEARYTEHLRMRLGRMDPEAFLALGIELSESEPLTPRLGEIRCPTLVLVGAQDRAFLGPADVMERAIPGARRVTLPDGGHCPQLETPDAWYAAVSEHLQRARGG